jgi:N-dimethylarginine dimethylaminohydrolase
MSTALPAYGVTSMVAPLRRVLVRRPAIEGDFLAAGWRVPDPGALVRQHEAFSELLARLGVEVVVAPAVPGLVDACFMYDSSFVIGSGAVLLRSGKPARCAETEPAAAALEAAGVPIVGRLEGGACMDGGDLIWLDERTILAARSYRTNAAGHAQLAALVAASGVTVERCDLVHDRGPSHVLHLMSVISPLAHDLALVFEPLAPVPLVEALDARGVRRISLDRDEYETLGGNVLAVRPGVLVVVDGNPRTRRALEAAGCEVHAYDGTELSLKGDGGPTCLTRPLLRSA